MAELGPAQPQLVCIVVSCNGLIIESKSSSKYLKHVILLQSTLMLRTVRAIIQSAQFIGHSFEGQTSSTSHSWGEIKMKSC